MLRAGLLTEKIHIYKEKKVESSSGFMEPEYEKTHTIKAAKKKLSAVVGSGVNASEEFIGNTLIFQTRRYSFLNENIRIKYGDNLYKVILIDPQNDNSFLITISKINE